MPVMEVSGRNNRHRGKSLPFTDYCAPITTDQIRAADLLDCVIEHGRQRGWKRFALRGGSELHKQRPPSCSVYFHTVSLEKEEKEIYSTFRSSTRRNIKKALNSGVTISRSQTLEYVNEYYSLH